MMALEGSFRCSHSARSSWGIVVSLGIPEAEVPDEVPVERYIKNFGHPCGIKDGNPAEAYPLRTGS